MARPTNKARLIDLCEVNLEQLLELTGSLTDEMRHTVGVNGKWRVVDILAHLTAWHELLETWYQAGMAGEAPEMPAPGHTWKTLSALNQQIFDANRHKDYQTALQELTASHRRVMDIIQAHSNQELFTKQQYAWTGSTTLGSLIISNTSSHYEWAHKLILKWLDTQRPANH